VAYVEYLLCKKFGWTITELDEQPQNRILEFLTIIRVEGQFEKLEQTKMDDQLGVKG